MRSWSVAPADVASVRPGIVAREAVIIGVTSGARNSTTGVGAAAGANAASGGTDRLLRVLS